MVNQSTITDNILHKFREYDAQAFSDAILDAKKSISLCPVCCSFTEGEGLCPICASSKRDDATVCVVADPKDVAALERSREYQKKCKSVCSKEEYAALEKAFFDKENNLKK